MKIYVVLVFLSFIAVTLASADSFNTYKSCTAKYGVDLRKQWPTRRRLRKLFSDQVDQVKCYVLCTRHTHRGQWIRHLTWTRKDFDVKKLLKVCPRIHIKWRQGKLPVGKNGLPTIPYIPRAKRPQKPSNNPIVPPFNFPPTNDPNSPNGFPVPPPNNIPIPPPGQGYPNPPPGQGYPNPPPIPDPHYLPTGTIPPDPPNDDDPDDSPPDDTPDDFPQVRPGPQENEND